MVEQRRTAAVLTVALGGLLLSSPRPTAALRSLSVGSPDVTAPLVAVVALAAWLLAGWLALTVLLVLAGRTSGALGSAAGALARRTAPAALRRTVEVALGLTVATSVLGGTAAAAGPGSAPPPAAATSGALDRPVVPAGASTPGALDRPASAPAAQDIAPPAARAATAAVPRPQDVPRAAPAPSDEVVVQPGDSLWALAERSLGPQASDRDVARTWPGWWAANREVVGDDPDLLLPGTRLEPPAPESAPTADDPDTR